MWLIKLGFVTYSVSRTNAAARSTGDPLGCGRSLLGWAVGLAACLGPKRLGVRDLTRRGPRLRRDLRQIGIPTTGRRGPRALDRGRVGTRAVGQAFGLFVLGQRELVRENGRGRRTGGPFDLGH